jgi:hypothetical protein
MHGSIAVHNTAFLYEHCVVQLPVKFAAWRMYTLQNHISYMAAMMIRLQENMKALIHI